MHAMNTNYVMCISHAMHVPASPLSLDIHDMPEITYCHAVCMSQMTSTKLSASHFIP